MEEKEPRFKKGDLDSVRAEYPHIDQWVTDFEAKWGSKPMYYGPLDRDAKKVQPRKVMVR